MTYLKGFIYELTKRKLSNRSKPPHIKMPDQRLTGASRSELHTKFEQRSMLLSHITLSAFMAFCTEGFREEPCN